MRYRFTIDDVACLELAVSYSSILRVIAKLATRDHIDHVRWMRVSLLLVAGFDSRLEHAHARVFEFQCNRTRIYDERVLFTCYTRVATHQSGYEQNKQQDVKSFHIRLLRYDNYT